MDIAGCECTTKSINTLENAIQYLLNKGRQVNQIMDKEKKINESRKREEVNLLRNKIDKPPKKRSIHNKKLGIEETIDFDIPSLTIESSTITPKPISPANELSSPSPSTFKSTRKTPPVISKDVTETVKTTITECVVTNNSDRNLQKAMVFRDFYTADTSGKNEMLPSEIQVKQRKDGSLDVFYKFFDENRKEAMNISLVLNGTNVEELKVDGKLAKPCE